MRRLPRCGPSVPVRRPQPITRPFASIPGRGWQSLAYHPGAQWKPRIDERIAIWVNKRKREVEGGGLPISESDLLTGSRRAFYVISELLSPALEKKDVPGDDQLRLLFTPLMLRWYHEYRQEYSLDGRRESENEEENNEEEEEPPCIWENKHEVMDVELLRWDENQGILKFTSASRYPHAVSGRMLFDHLWLFKHTVPRGATSSEKRFLLHEIAFPEL